MSNYHQHMIDLMKSLGYQINDNGMCHGIVMMGVQAFLSHELPKFEQRLKFIEEHRHALLKQLNELKTRLATLAADNKQREQLHLLPQPILFTSDEESFIDTWAFLEGVALYFDPTIYPQQFGELLHQNDTEKISALTSSLSLDKLGGLKKIAAWPGMYKKDELSHYLFLLDQYIRAGNQDIALTFASENHSIAFAYDANTQQWLLIDSNELPPPVISVEKWAEIVATKFHESNIIGFETLIQCTGNHASAVKKIIENVKKDIVFQKLHEITVEKAKRVTSRNISLLHLAAKCGNKNIVQMLIDNKANINQAENNGVTPLYIAAHNGHKDIAKMLIDNGADINQAKNNGVTPLWIAAQNGHKDIVNMLIKKGANINQKYNEDITPLYIATQNGHKDIMKMLIKNGANINQAKNNGATPLLIAAQIGNEKIVDILLTKQANINISLSSTVKSLLDFSREKNIEDSMRGLIEYKQTSQNEPSPKITVALLEITIVLGNSKIIEIFDKHHLLTNEAINIAKACQQSEIINYLTKQQVNTNMFFNGATISSQKNNLPLSDQLTPPRKKPRH